MNLLELPLSLSANARPKRCGCVAIACGVAWQSNLLVSVHSFILPLLCQVLSFGSAVKFLVGYHGSSFILFAFCFRFVVGVVLWRGCSRG